MSKHQKLELTWIGKEQRPRLEPGILLEDPARSYHAKKRVTEKDLFDNRLIKGDNPDVYQPLVDKWALYDNAGDEPVLMDWSGKP